jgi:(E)-4-hydroxy-3-methylbut-2-enyl-diphosphate synthase
LLGVDLATVSLITSRPERDLPAADVDASRRILQVATLERKKTRTISVGNVKIGGNNPVVVQSMLKTDLQNLQETLGQLRDLKRVGCELVRIALPHEETCKIIPFLKREVDMPIVGDIHFNHVIALKAMELGIDGIRINPGTINNMKKVKEVANAARERQIPVRIGINIGSLEKRILKKYRKPDANAMVESALSCIKVFEDAGHTAIKVSLKASDILQTVEAYRKFAEVSEYPLHVGVTEAGPLFSGVIKSSMGIGILLYEGIGDTIRVSLTGSPVHEVTAAYHILRGLGLRKRGINIISCPTCGRCRINLREVVEEFERETGHIDAYADVAIMGCEVNGPGEARDADIGIAFGAHKAILFSKGTVKKTGIPKELAKDMLVEEIGNLIR